MVRAPPRVLPRSLAPSGALGGGRSGPGSPLLGLGLWGWRKGVPGGGAFHCCEGRLGSGPPPPPTARPLGGLLGSATHVLRARACGCGGPTLSPWPARPVGAVCRGGGGGPSPYLAWGCAPPVGRVRGVRVPGGGLGGEGAARAPFPPFVRPGGACRAGGRSASFRPSAFLGQATMLYVTPLVLWCTYGAPVVPAEGRKCFQLKSSWRKRRQSKILAVSLKHWKRTGRGGSRGSAGGSREGYPPPPTGYGRSDTSLGVGGGYNPLQTADMPSTTVLPTRSTMLRLAVQCSDKMRSKVGQAATGTVALAWGELACGPFATRPPLGMGSFLDMPPAAGRSRHVNLLPTKTHHTEVMWLSGHMSPHNDMGMCVTLEAMNFIRTTIYKCVEGPTPQVWTPTTPPPPQLTVGCRPPRGGVGESAALGRGRCRRAQGRQDQWGRHARSRPERCCWGQNRIHGHQRRREQQQRKQDPC